MPKGNKSYRVYESQAKNGQRKLKGNYTKVGDKSDKGANIEQQKSVEYNTMLNEIYELVKDDDVIQNMSQRELDDFVASYLKEKLK